ncbi:alpha/beta fold hydrolase [Pseudonocardia sp. CA-107938]|uniref:alpha/beta fold hydrolase n=1 Tax=Pseudonocardia sp. CA-107938 TaxID=3240021 RepID=UPI003D9508FA
MSTAVSTAVATSADGTSIAYERHGTGRPLVLIGGAFNDRSTGNALAAALAPDVATVTVDRRGRGASGYRPDHDPAREVEDVAAVIAAVGGEADLFGHSSGAVLAIECVLAGLPVRRLAVYEPPFVVTDDRPRAIDLFGRLSALVALQRRDEAVALFLTEAALVPAEFVDGMRADAATWDLMTGLAHTLPHDSALFAPDQGVRGAERYPGITVPTLAVAGGASPAWLQAGAAWVAEQVPGARHVVLPGADHGVLGAPADLATVVREFLA